MNERGFIHMKEPRELKTAKLIVLIEPSLKNKVESTAGADSRYKVHGEPSSAAVVRDALRLFFGLPVHLRESILAATNETTQAA
jgi:hypothetical protein